ncbi:hypothetical protein M9H77_29430 [Catharanthus roseus]|uniref:Uncharacterized protein n=1 Tax=Catharanthus roseus TaxID=4058 RepID=A0ACB9ZUD1_CATRO|nr:hypothetical protein M9H77_29430 [Catharanthus roseus]
MSRMSPSSIEVRQGPMTRAQRKKLKLQEDNGMIAYIMEALKRKFDEFEDQGKHPKLFTMCSIVKEQSRKHLGKDIAKNWLGTRVGTLLSATGSPLPLPIGFCWGNAWSSTTYRSRKSYKSSIEVLHEEVILGRIWIQFNKQKRIHTKVEQEQPPIEGQIELLIVSTDGHMPTQSHHEGTNNPSRMNLKETLRDVEDLKKGESSATIEQRVGDILGGFNSRHHRRPFDNISTCGYHDTPVQNSHPFHEVGYQGRPQFRGGRRGEDTPKVAFKYHSKPKVEEKGKLITIPTRCFKCNVGHIAINCLTKRTLVFTEDLNGWIENSEDDFQEGIVDKDQSSEGFRGHSSVKCRAAKSSIEALHEEVILGRILIQFHKKEDSYQSKISSCHK